MDALPPSSYIIGNQQSRLPSCGKFVSSAYVENRYERQEKLLVVYPGLKTDRNSHSDERPIHTCGDLVVFHSSYSSRPYFHIIFISIIKSLYCIQENRV